LSSPESADIDLPIVKNGSLGRAADFSELIFNTLDEDKSSSISLSR
jgi:hypothetical protein